MRLDSEYLGWLLAELAEKHHVPGAQIAVQTEGMVLTAENGCARHGTGSPVLRSSTFPLGSVTKSFTATVAMQLVAAGDLDLDEPIGTYLPEMSRGGLARQVTARHLLSHTSGLPSDFEPDEPATRSLARFARDCVELAPVCPPGTTFSYSNVGYVLIGHLIEVLTGTSWWEAMESLLLGPLGIEPAFCVDPRQWPRQGPTAVGHSVNLARGRVVPVKPMCQLCDAPAAGLAGSASDLLALGRMHIEKWPGFDDLFAGLDLEEMRRDAGGGEPFGLAAGWGLGVAIFRCGSTTWFGHDGTTDGGTTCHLRFDPASGVAIAVTTNAISGFRLWEGLLRNLGDAGLAIGSYTRPAITPERTTDVPDCVGDYVNGDVRYRVSRTPDSRLRLDLGDGERTELTFRGGLVFSAEEPSGDELPIVGRFVRDQRHGEIELMEISGRVARRYRTAQGER